MIHILCTKHDGMLSKFIAGSVQRDAQFNSPSVVFIIFIIQVPSKSCVECHQCCVECHQYCTSQLFSLGRLHSATLLTSFCQRQVYYAIFQPHIRRTQYKCYRASCKLQACQNDSLWINFVCSSVPGLFIPTFLTFTPQYQGSIPDRSTWLTYLPSHFLF